jgi:hypothetical protein
VAGIRAIVRIIELVPRQVENKPTSCLAWFLFWSQEHPTGFAVIIIVIVRIIIPARRSYHYKLHMQASELKLSS